jgi:hypothetical protein
LRNAVVCGLFFGGPAVVAQGSASFAPPDTTTQGTWQGSYGADGYNILGDSSSYPAYAQVTASGQSSYTWASSTSDNRALQRASTGGRIASCWYSFNSITLSVNLTDSRAHKLSLYVLDWDVLGRSERINILDAGTGAPLDSETVSNFSAGKYLTWTVKSPVVLIITNLGGVNAVISGLFFDAAATNSTTQLASTASTSVWGQNVTFTATVSAGPGTAAKPTGTVTFLDGTTTLGTATLASNGTAAFTTPSLSVGSHSITAVYSGDGSFTGSSSAVLTQTVNKAATTTTVVSTANSSPFGKAVTFTATMSAVAPGAGTPTGSVTFRDGNTILGTGTLNNNGTATFTTSSLSVGSHAITVVYAGDGNFSGSTSATLTQVITEVPPAAPTGLQWSLVSGNTIQLSWSAAALADGYRVYEWSAVNEKWILLMDIGTNQTSVTINNGYGNYFMVGAYNSALESLSGWIFAGNP